MNQEQNKRNLFDLATIITLGGILLYQMSWIYWTNYFSNLNIDSSFIDMPIDKFIATTWHLMIIIPSSFVIAIILIYENNDNNKLHLPSVIIATIISFNLLLFTLKRDYDILYVIFGLLFIYAVYCLIELKLNLKRSSIGKRKFIYFTLGITYILSFCVYYLMGDRASKELIMSFKKNDIEIALNHDNKIIKGKFIIHMKEKYFILVKNKKQKNETIIINDSEVYHSRFIN